MSENVYARAALRRAKRLRAGEVVSAKETARILTNAAQTIQYLESKAKPPSDAVMQELAALRAYKQGVQDGLRCNP